MNDRFEHFSNHEKQLLFEALLHCIRTNSGIGFKGNDQGHPVYVQGSEDGTNTGWEYADSPEANDFYRMYRELALHARDWPQVGAYHKYCTTDWRQFCTLATRYYGRHKNKPLIERAIEE